MPLDIRGGEAREQLVVQLEDRLGVGKDEGAVRLGNQGPRYGIAGPIIVSGWSDLVR